MLELGVDRLELFTRLREQLDQIKPPVGRKPLAIFTYGPPASGKGFMMQHLSTILGVPATQFAQMNVDDVVSEFPQGALGLAHHHGGSGPLQHARL